MSPVEAVRQAARLLVGQVSTEILCALQEADRILVAAENVTRKYGDHVVGFTTRYDHGFDVRYYLRGDGSSTTVREHADPMEYRRARSYVLRSPNTRFMEPV